MGADEWRLMRRWLFTFGANSDMAPGRYFCNPAICPKKSAVGEPSALLNMFLRVFVSMMLWCKCMALPGSLAIGFAMNVAYILCRKAASRAVRLNKKAWSARLMG